MTHNPPIKSNRPAWDKQHNSDHLYRYVECKNPSCKHHEIAFSANSDEAQYKHEGFIFDPNHEIFNCELCGSLGSVEYEYNEDGESYIFPSKSYLEEFTVILSVYDGHDRETYLKEVTSSSAKTAYEDALNSVVQDFDLSEIKKRGELYDVHLWTFSNHLKPIVSGD